MAITPLPTPPSREDPTNFATRADAFMAALPDFATETNAVAVEVDADRVAAAASASSAATQVTLATAQVALASAQRVLAETAASAASATANVTQWVSGTTYALGANVWSPINAQTYRRIIAGAGTTDPSADSTNWTKISENLTPASQAEMVAGTETALRSMSPLRIAQAVAALAGGANFQATASGSISSGAPVIVNADGTVSAISETAVTTAPAFTLSRSVSYSGNSDAIAVALDTKRNKIYKVFINPTDNISPHYGIWYATGTIDVDTQRINFSESKQLTQFIGQNPYGVGENAPALIYDSVQDQLYYVWQKTNSVTAYLVLQINENGELQARRAQTDMGIGMQRIAGGYFDAVNNKSVIAYCHLSSGQVRVASFTYNATTNQLDYNSNQTTISAHTPDALFRIEYSEETSKAIVSYGLSNAFLIAFVITLSGNTFTVGAQANLAPPSIRHGTIFSTYHPFNGKWIFQYADNTSVYPWAVVGTVSGTDITFGTAVTIASTSTTTRYGRPFVNANNATFFATYTGNLKLGTVSGTSITFGTNFALTTDYVANSCSVYAPSNNLWFLANNYNNDIGDVMLRMATTTLKRSNFIGISANTYSNGQTAVVNIVGSKATNVSGLTAGKKYYVKSNGGLTTTETLSYAGLALSSTSMIIKG